MMLSKLKISNFRCFSKEETVIIFHKLTTLIGANSTGKTATMQALIKLFGATQGEREIHRADFHLVAGQTPETLDDSNLYIEAVFQFPELKDAKSSKSAIPSFFRYFIVDGPEQVPYLRIRLESSYTRDESPEGAIDTKYYFVVSSESEELSEATKKSAPRNILSNIKCIYVPALRNPSEQLRNVSGTILYRLLSGVKWTPKITDKLKGFIDNINNTVEAVPRVTNVQTVLQNQWSKYHDDLRYAQTKIAFSASDINSILKNAEIKFSPTELPRDYDVSELGDGLRSLFYFSLVNTLLKVENDTFNKATEAGEESNRSISTPPVLTIVAVEEPENHIAPQLMGKVILNLKEIASHENAQVVLSSHTPAIIRRIDATNLRYLRLEEDTQSTIVNEVHLPKKDDTAYKFIKEAVEAYPEIYFARLVILGEGDSEMLVLPIIIEKVNKNIDVLGIAIAPLGGRYVNHFWRLLNQLNIPHITLLDLDKERAGGGWGRIKYALTQLIQNGIDKTELLAKEDTIVLTDDELEEMHKWDVHDFSKMNFWLHRLEQYNVFYSAPLDLDFLLLEHYPECYKNTIEENQGPYIPIFGKIKDLEVLIPPPSSYIERMQKNVKDVLKDEGGDGSTYTDDQKKLMVWYNYLFLNRSKPVTHLVALSAYDFGNVEALPEPLRTIFKKTISNQ